MLIGLTAILPPIFSAQSLEVKKNSEPTYSEPYLQAVLSAPQPKPSTEPKVVLVLPPDKTEAKRIVTYWLDYYGADVVLGNCIVSLESGYNALAKNKTSSAAGLYQFIRSTFNSTAKRMGLPYVYDTDVYDANVNAMMGAWLLANDGYKHWIVWPSCVKQ